MIYIERIEINQGHNSLKCFSLFIINEAINISFNMKWLLFNLSGDLKTYLLARRHLVYEKSREDSDEISGRRLTSIALDVAKALSYLAEQKYVHR